MKQTQQDTKSKALFDKLCNFCLASKLCDDVQRVISGVKSVLKKIGLGKIE
jgi:hypothetical protein